MAENFLNIFSEVELNAASILHFYKNAKVNRLQLAKENFLNNALILLSIVSYGAIR